MKPGLDRTRMTDMVVGIDASRNRSGGAKAHLIGILKETDPTSLGISKVHVWAYRSLLDALPDTNWLVKHSPPALEKSLIEQLWWQFRHLPREVRANRCDVLFATDAGSVCAYRPSVVMSQDMLSYEPGEMRRYGFSAARLRLILLKFVQTRAMKRAAGVIFLTEYASRVIQADIGRLARVSVISHGVGVSFKQADVVEQRLARPCASFNCVYVSNAEFYKHHWHVVSAVAELRKRGHLLKLSFAGGGSGRAQRMLDAEIRRSDPENHFVESIGFVRHEDLPNLLANADIFVFASSCENLPITLIEGMASGLPIACSDRGPMPEVLQDGGVYFDPEQPASICTAVESLLTDRDLRLSKAKRAAALSREYSWQRCGDATWRFLLETVAAVRERGAQSTLS